MRRGGGTGRPESRLEHWVAEPAWLPVVSRMRVRCMSEMGVSGRSVLLLLLQGNGDAWTSPGGNNADLASFSGHRKYRKPRHVLVSCTQNPPAPALARFTFAYSILVCLPSIMRTIASCSPSNL